MATRFADHLLDGDHASRPAANTVPAGTLYSCTDHDLIYQSDGSSWATWATLGGSGGGVTVLNYTEKTSDTTVGATTEGSPTTIITASGGIVVDGSTLICAEFYSPNVTVGSTFLILNLWDDTASASLGRLAGLTRVSTTAEVFARRYFTPAAGTRTYSVRGWRGGSDGTVGGGAGGTTSYFPAYLRLTSGG